MDLLQTLTDLANGLRIARDGSGQVAPGQAVAFRLIPTTTQLNVPALLAGDVNLLGLTKDVRFGDFQPVQPPIAQNLDLLGGMPITVVTGTIAGVQGILGQVTGSIPIPLQIPVSVTITWSIQDMPQSDDLKPQGNTLTLGSDFLAPDGLKAPEISLVFNAPVVELTTNIMLPIKLVYVYVHAQVVLSAQGVTTQPIDLPEVPLTIPPLAIPTVAAFFDDPNFNAHSVFVMVPASSPLKSVNDLNALLTPLQNQVSALSQFANFANFFLGIQLLSAALAAQPHVQFRSEDAERDLENIVWVPGSTFGTDYDADDAFSSLIFMAAPNAVTPIIQLSNEDNLDFWDEGGFEVHVGSDMYAALSQFSGNTEAQMSQFLQPASASMCIIANGDSFNNQASSVAFSDLARCTPATSTPPRVQPVRPPATGGTPKAKRRSR
ncbi:MAG TPA: hypothetical protein VHV32_03425 [Candidatus Angelobacter sp.]|jgi:hypothetical protein|nr:hypothetical protein [Candidatus Angelobacter sp.]